MSGSWSNSSQDLIILTEQVTGFSGLFGYSPTVGPGNLVFSLTAAAGTDPYGNAYRSGLTIYSAGQALDSVGDANGDIISYVPGSSGSYLKMGSAQLTWGGYNSNTDSITPNGGAISTVTNDGVPNFNGQMILASPRGGEDVPDQLVATLQSGSGGNPTGSGLNPRAVLVDGTDSAAVDLYLSGSVVATDLAGNATTWHAAGAGTSWSIGTLMYRNDGLDNVVWKGSLSYTGANIAGASIFTAATAAAPAAYRPKADRKSVV